MSPLDAPPLGTDLPLLRILIVKEYVYCPRRADLEWVRGEWADTSNTVEG
jgi:hypothetical protein